MWRKETRNEKYYGKKSARKNKWNYNKTWKNSRESCQENVHWIIVSKTCECCKQPITWSLQVGSTNPTKRLCGINCGLIPSWCKYNMAIIIKRGKMKQGENTS